MKKLTRWIAILLCIALLIPYVPVYAATKTGIVTASTLNVRSKPGTNYPIVQVNESNVYVKKGDLITITDTLDGWYEIKTTFNGKSVTGYVSSDYVTLQKTDDTPQTTPTPSPSPTPDSSTATTTKALSWPGVVTATSLRVRSKASTSSAQVKVNNALVSLKKDTKVTILKQTTNQNQIWYYIQFSVTDASKKTTKHKGYVLSDYVKLSLTSSVKANISSSTKVKVRIAAGSKKAYLAIDNKIATLSNKKYIIITKEVTTEGTKWFKVWFTYNSKKYTGYVPASVVAIMFSQTVTTSSTTEPSQEPSVSPSPTPSETPTPSPSVSPSPSPETTPEIESKVQSGKISAAAGTSVYMEASDTSMYVTGTNGVVLLLQDQHPITIHATTKINNTTWCLISFLYQDGNLYAGFLPSNLISVTGSSSTDTTMSSEQFEKNLTEQGFPESYKAALRQLHEQYPYWQFEAYKTGLDWNTVIANESLVGLNLIPNTKGVEWKSLEKGAYTWQTDRFVPYDGSTWVTASKEAISYYMDPRNFLTVQGIFQFESLSYQNTYQTLSGVEMILKNTPFEGKSYSYVDLDGTTKTMTYAQTFMEAAQVSLVSPYHLATRVKQEVVTGTTTVSNSITGTVSGLEGLYNFYNIGASHSTVSGGAIANGLNFAKNGYTNGKMYNSTISMNDYMLIPWVNPFRSIVGGANYIGSDYIQRGQNTLYLEKFNVTSKSRYSHQYMSNVEAPYAESKKIYTAYTGMMDLPLLFSIPVYENMPATACAAPTTKYNPNNWLKQLEVEGFTLTPTFDPTVDQVYSLIVDKTVASVNVIANTASTKASMTGAGQINLATGSNLATITVTAQNGDVKTYYIQIVREE